MSPAESRPRTSRRSSALRAAWTLANASMADWVRSGAGQIGHGLGRAQPVPLDGPQGVLEADHRGIHRFERSAWGGVLVELALARGQGGADLAAVDVEDRAEAVIGEQGSDAGRAPQETVDALDAISHGCHRGIEFDERCIEQAGRRRRRAGGPAQSEVGADRSLRRRTTAMMPHIRGSSVERAESTGVPGPDHRTGRPPSDRLRPRCVVDHLVRRRASRRPPRGASATSAASSWVGASTITRMSGSVPLARSRTRPRSPSALRLAADVGAQLVEELRVASSGADVDQHLWQSGHGRRRPARRASVPCEPSPTASATPVSMPSPVEARSRKIT